MGIGVIVHGFIDSVGYGNQEPSKLRFRHNRKVLQALPESDDEWPFFTRSMFSMLPLRNSLALNVPQYESLVISFGASYKNMYALEAAWIRKFELLLSKLCWDRASVFVDFSSLKYDWEVDRDQDAINYLADPPIPPTKWSLTFKRLSEEEVTIRDAVDGVYTPFGS